MTAIDLMTDWFDRSLLGGPLDLATVLIFETASSLTLAMVLLFVTQGKSYRGLGIWVWGLILNTLVIPAAPETFLVPLVSMTLAATYLFLNAALIKLRESPCRNPVLSVLSGIALINLLSNSHPPIRLILYNVLFLLELAMVLKTLIGPGGKPPVGKGKYVFFLALGLQAILYLARLHMGFAHQFGWTQAAWNPALPQSMTMFALMFTTLLYSLALLIMVMEASEAEIYFLLNRDTLTGVWNRRKADEIALQNREKGKQRQNSPLSIIMADIDHFKCINDTHGHAMGDTILKQFAACLNGGLRATDTLCRWGGEEFLIIMPATDYTTAGEIAERLQKRTAEARYDEYIKVTASFGYTQANPGELWEVTVNRADEALYQAKESGRNQIKGQIASSPSAVPNP